MAFTKKDIRQLIASIDRLIKEQLIAILEDTHFKDLLASWSALKYLADIAGYKDIKVKIFDIGWSEIPSLIANDTELSGPLAKKLFDEFDLPGNEPLSLIVGDYTFDASKKKEVELLSYFGEVASYTFSPFITTITPSVLGIQNFHQLYRLHLTDVHTHENFRHLARLASTSHASFLGVVIPKVLIPSLLDEADDFYTCPILGPDFEQYRKVYVNGAYMLAAVVVNSFINTGWFLEITFSPTNALFEQRKALSNNSFFAENFSNIPYIFFKYTTECLITERKEKELADLGFIPLCHVKNRDFAVFHSANSLRNLHSKTIGNNQIPNELQYMLCVSKFAHYIKIIGRQKLGLYSNASEFQDYLNNWLLQYISSDIETPLHLKYKYPLLEAKVEISEDNFLQDNYICTIYLKPHLTSTQLSANIVLKTRFTALNKRAQTTQP